MAVRDGKMIVAYSLVTRVYNEGEKENNHNYGMDIYEIHIAVINIKNKEIIKDFVPGKEFLYTCNYNRQTMSFQHILRYIHKKIYLRYPIP